MAKKKERLFPEKFYIVKNVNEEWKNLPSEPRLVGDYYRGPYLRQLIGNSWEFVPCEGLATIYHSKEKAQHWLDVANNWVEEWLEEESICFDEDYTPSQAGRTKKNKPKLKIIEVEISFKEV